MNPSSLSPPSERAPRRLLALLPSFDVGGAEKFALDLFGQLAARGWSVTAVGDQPSPNRWLDEFRRLTEELRTMDHLKRAQMPFFVSDLIDSRRPDVVLVSQSRFGFLLLPYLRFACPGPAYVDFCHIEEEWGGGGYPRMAAGLDPFVDLHLVTSEYLRRWMIDRGADPSRTEVCTVNVDPAAWRSDPEVRRRVRQAHGIPDDLPVILFAGRLTAQKQPRVLAAVLNVLARRGLRFQALIAGDGEDREWIEDFLRRNRMGGCARVLGLLAGGQVRDLLAAADIFFLPSRWEGIALSIYEAMAMQVAVLGADVGGQAELVTPDCGILLKPAGAAREIEAYAGKLAWLIEHPGERRAMAERARDRIVQHFTLDNMGARIDALLREIPARTRTFGKPSFPPSPDPAIHARRLKQTIDDTAGRLAACAIHGSDDSRMIEFWRVVLSESFVNSDSTGLAAPLRAYFERAALERLDAMPSWRLYRKIAPFTVPGWRRMSPADRIARFSSSFLRRILRQNAKR